MLDGGGEDAAATIWEQRLRDSLSAAVCEQLRRTATCESSRAAARRLYGSIFRGKLETLSCVGVECKGSSRCTLSVSCVLLV